MKKAFITPNTKIALWFLIFSGSCYAQDSVPVNPTSSPVVSDADKKNSPSPQPILSKSDPANIRADLRLLYSDRFKNPVSSYFQENPIFTYRMGASDSGRDIASHRTFGLDKAELGLSYAVLGQSEISFDLRPDVLNREEEERSPDHRAGKVYFREASPKFFDRYAISMNYEPNLRLSAGVMKDLASSSQAYESPLDFGLGIVFPQRFAAVQAAWKQTKNAETSADPNRGDGLSVTTTVFQSRNQRAEAQAFQDSTQDHAPATADPHRGVAISFGYSLSLNHLLTLLIGTHESEYEISAATQTGSPTSSPSLTGRRDQIFAQFGQSLTVNVFKIPTTIGLDIRAMLESWSSSSFNIRRRRHESVSVTTRFRVVPDFWFLAGGHHAKSDVSDLAQVDGYQLEGGLLMQMRENILLSTLMAEEHRHENFDGEKVGGFSISGSQVPVLRRFALQLQYVLGPAR